MCLDPHLNLSPSYTVTILSTNHHDSSRFEPDGKIGVHRDASGLKKRKSSINTLPHDAPTVSARLIYGPTTNPDGSATIHHGGATNAHDASTIRYGASIIQAGSTTVASRPPTNVHDLVVVMWQFAKLWHQKVMSRSHIHGSPRRFELRIKSHGWPRKCQFP